MKLHLKVSFIVSLCIYLFFAFCFWDYKWIYTTIINIPNYTGMERFTFLCAIGFKELFVWVPVAMYQEEQAKLKNNERNT